MRIAQGTKDPVKTDTRQIAVRWPVKDFEEIAAEAIEAGLPFAEYVRVLVARGRAAPVPK